MISKYKGPFIISTGGEPVEYDFFDELKGGAQLFDELKGGSFLSFHFQKRFFCGPNKTKRRLWDQIYFKM